MTGPIRVESLTAAGLTAGADDLAGLLRDAVADGASVGFLASLTHDEARAWWLARAGAVAAGGLRVWLARDGDGRPAGTVSLALPDKPNAWFRGEVVKLMVHRSARGHGLGRALLATAERAAAGAGLPLLMLDTETGSVADTLYERAGWTRYGVVPAYAADPSGVPRPCSFFYKPLA